MITVREVQASLPVYDTRPLTGLALLYDPEHLYPYPSQHDTRDTPRPRRLRFVVLESAALRVTVAPDLGGRIYSIIDKRRDAELLFCNPVVKPTRILPVWAFVSGGIEFNFPISHAPTGATTVGCVHGVTGDCGVGRGLDHGPEGGGQALGVVDEAGERCLVPHVEPVNARLGADALERGDRERQVPRPSLRVGEGGGLRLLVRPGRAARHRRPVSWRARSAAPRPSGPSRSGRSARNGWSRG